MTFHCFQLLLASALCLHAIPLLRAVVALFKRILSREQSVFKTNFLSRNTGRLEYLFGPFRDRILPLIFSVIFLYLMIFRFSEFVFYSKEFFLILFYFVFFLLLAFFNDRTRVRVRLTMTKLARLHSNIHPQDFFDQYYRMLGIAAAKFPRSGFRLLEWDNADFRTGKTPKLVLLPMFSAALATNTLARLAILAFNKNGATIGRDCFDGLARIWSSRLTQIFKCRLYSQGSENIPVLKGKTLVILNHNSYLDFVLNFFAMGKIRVQDLGSPQGSEDCLSSHSNEHFSSEGSLGPEEKSVQQENGEFRRSLEENLDLEFATSSPKKTRPLRLRFIAAKDHFVDNPIIYSWISLGKVIENVGMILINRRKKGEGWKAMQEAAKKLVETDVEVAVYPQGTRAHLLTYYNGERWDSGYYTSFNPKSKNHHSHLKPGTAHLILDTLLQLRQKGYSHLNILAAGIMGAGTVAPKGSLPLRLESEIGFNIPPLWQVTTDFIEGVEVPQSKHPQTAGEELYYNKIAELQEMIDEKLASALQWHSRLIEFLKREMQTMEFFSEEIEKLLNFLQKHDKNLEKLIFMTLERVLCLEKNLRKDYVQKLLEWSQQDSQEEEFWNAKIAELTEKMVK